MRYPTERCATPGRWPPLPWLVLCFIVIIALVTVLGLPSPVAVVPTVRSPYSYRSYRDLREQMAGDLLEIQSMSNGAYPHKEIGFCGKQRENYVPCYNSTANKLAGFLEEEVFDRHCELETAPVACLVQPPKEYRIPLRWPAGRDVIWGGNVKITKDQLVSSGSMTKRLMLLEDNQIAFHTEDGMSFDSVSDYSRQIAEMIGLESDSEFLSAGVHSVLDIGCGFGSFGAHLLSLKLMSVCIAAYEVFGSQVQLALERGLPAIIGSFVAKQLPYPSLSFDMVHCAQCGIVWDKKDGVLLIEADRVLKPGGYFVLTSPIGKIQSGPLAERNKIMFTAIENLAQKICWTLLGQQEETYIWQKTTDANCYASRNKKDAIPLCKDEVVDSYYHPLLSCISGTTSKRWIPVQNMSIRSVSRLSLEELEHHGLHHEEFIEHSHTWEEDLKNYWSLLTPLIFSDHPKRPGDEDPLPPFNMLRNIMDMNAIYGGLNAALLEAEKSVWVMNVVPSGTHSTLPLILDRGFAGVLHDWCEPFPTYPRTYDFLHAMGLLSHPVLSKKCNISNLLLEMDRILRPEGWVIIRDNIKVTEKARIIATQLHWDARVITLEGEDDQQLLVCQKPFLKRSLAS